MENIEQLEKKAQKIAKKHGLVLLLLFGSQANGNTHKFSDYDFGFVGTNELDYIQIGELHMDLQKLVSSRFVEAVDLKKSGPFLLKEIAKNNRVLFSKEDAYENFFSYAVRRYLESDRIFELQKTLYKQTVNKYKQKIYAK
jgi:predicted nucleotidyltransferase